MSDDGSTPERSPSHLPTASLMHCVHLADIAAIVADNSPSILYRCDHVPTEAMTSYWVSSRKRTELWHQAMGHYRAAESIGKPERLRAWWKEHLAILEEVIVSQILTRVIAALASELDQKQANNELSPITHAIYLSDLDATRRVHRLMLQGRGISVPEAVKLNRLRQGVERWTDALLGRMSRLSPESLAYSIDPTRAKTFAEETLGYGNGSTRRTVSWLMNASMRDMLSRRTSTCPALPRANLAVASSVALMLRPELFDSVGVLRSLWTNRLQLDHLHADCSPDRGESEKNTIRLDEKHQNAFKDSVFQRWYL